MREAVKTFYPFLGGEFDSNRGRACFALPCLVAFAFFLRLFSSGLPIPNLSAYVADVLIYDPLLYLLSQINKRTTNVPRNLRSRPTYEPTRLKIIQDSRFEPIDCKLCLDREDLVLPCSALRLFLHSRRGSVLRQDSPILTDRVSLRLSVYLRRCD